jgi:hypothetical protein
MSDIRVIIVGKIDKADWQHNFALVDAALDELGFKLPASQKAAANGLASLNGDLKVIQTALNSERLNGKTEAELSQLFILLSTKGSAGGVAELDGSGKLKADQLPASVVSGLVYKGGWNANTNSPTIPAAAGGNENWFYIVTTAGTTSIDGINSWAVGDWIISNGVSWEKVATTADVLTVAGKTGNVLLEIEDIDGLEDELDGKLDKGANADEISPASFDDLLVSGNYYIADVGSVTDGAGDGGAALFRVTKGGPLVFQELILANGTLRSRVFDGTWSTWAQTN